MNLVEYLFPLNGKDVAWHGNGTEILKYLEKYWEGEKLVGDILLNIEIS